MKSIHSWEMFSPFVFHDRACGGSVIGLMDDYGNLLEAPPSSLIPFLTSDGE